MTRVHNHFATVYDRARPLPPLLQEAICSQVRELLSSNAPRLLDIGAGTGVIRWCDRDGAEIVRLDHAHAMLVESNGSGPQLCAEAAALPFRDTTFDAVASRHVLEALQHRGPVLDEIRRVLKPGAPYLHAVSTPPSYLREIHTRWRELTNLVRVANGRLQGFEAASGDIELDLVSAGASISRATSFIIPVSQLLDDVLAGYVQKAYPSCWQVADDAHEACVAELVDWARLRFMDPLVGRFRSTLVAAFW